MAKHTTKRIKAPEIAQYLAEMGEEALMANGKLNSAAAAIAFDIDLEIFRDKYWRLNKRLQTRPEVEAFPALDNIFDARLRIASLKAKVK